MIYPLAIGGACIITSIIGTWFVKLGQNKSIMGALYKGFILQQYFLILMYPVTDTIIGIEKNYDNSAGAIFTGLDLYICGVVGFVITGLLIWVTEYYAGTDYRPVKTVAKSSTTGHEQYDPRISYFYGSNSNTCIDNSCRNIICK